MKQKLPQEESAHGMEAKRLHLIRLLYGEALPNGVAPEEDPELAAEWQALWEVKSWLDAQPRRRPDPAVIDRIVAAAARPVAADRPPQRGIRRWRWHVAVSALVLLVVGGVWFWSQEAQSVNASGVVVAEQGTTAPEPLDETFWIQLAASLLSTQADPAASRVSALQWDDRDEVQQVYRQLQILEARSAPEAWDPAMPLEAWPTGSRRQGLVPAARRNY